MERIIKVKDTLVSLIHEEPKAECGHLLTVLLGLICLAGILIAIVMTKP